MPAMLEILGASGTETAPKETTRRKMTTEPPYKVILHNDDYTPMEHVIQVLRKVIPRMSLRRAVS
ncbi:MAG TPA: ATP-dependent Clp protease adaptor ClpS, partial [Rubrobacteraceae bacterium]|nr:ATP-dependent Clp protease adaptor ClpS [Rubrobacteraceae bacterium]